ncbi:ribosomal L1 domain-containing protein 1-like [Neocloeon triangulifer]|uniref:ribosomal L1 domain-containing protein 1-like n=1 Tax=Neocloeon triangulifer TaxID=2078957 RepID=UPI00286F2EE7|nr:ribosomal L1 domain-containing protein 1-like [Neocloeon triangulifer]
MKVRKSMTKPRTSLVSKKPKSPKLTEKVAKKSKKVKNASGVVYPPENLIKPDLQQEIVEKAAESLLKLHAKSLGDKVNLLGGNEGEPIFLNFSQYRMLDGPSRILRMDLPHSLLEETSDVALIVPDLEHKTKNPDNEAVAQLYESRLRARGLKQRIQIITLRQIMTEYKTYESKRKLCNSFDLFLADGRIIGRLVPLLGKHFQTAKKNPFPVRTQPIATLVTSIHKAMSKTMMPLNSKGNSRTTRIGHTNMEPSQIAENAIEATKAICKELPGGWPNIRNMHLISLRTPSVPFYMSIKNPNEIKITSTRKIVKHDRPVEGELTTTVLDNFRVRVMPDGEVEMIDDEGKILSKKRKLEAMKDLGMERKRKYAAADAVLLASEEGDKDEEDENVVRVVPKFEDADMDAEFEDDDVEDELEEEIKAASKGKGSKRKKKEVVENSDEEEEQAVRGYEDAYLNELELETKEKAKKAKKNARKEPTEEVKPKKKGKKNVKVETMEEVRPKRKGKKIVGKETTQEVKPKRKAASKKEDAQQINTKKDASKEKAEKKGKKMATPKASEAPKKKKK